MSSGENPGKESKTLSFAKEVVVNRSFKCSLQEKGQNGTVTSKMFLKKSVFVVRCLKHHWEERDSSPLELPDRGYIRASSKRGSFMKKN